MLLIFARQREELYHIICKVMTVLHVTESSEIALSNGTVYVDTSGGSVTLLLRSGGGELTICKTSADSNVVALYCPDGCIGRGEIMIFGLPPHARISKGKATTVVLRGHGPNWKVVRMM